MSLHISFGLDSVLDLIFSQLTSLDLRQARLVSLGWLSTVERLTLHREGGRLGWGWREGEPSLARLQCSKERSEITAFERKTRHSYYIGSSLFLNTLGILFEYSV